MATDRNRLLDKFNTNQILGKGFGGQEDRNPTAISQSNQGPYNVNQFVYPSDLTQREDLQHYIVFYVNIRGKTKFQPGAKEVVNVDVSSRGQNRLSGNGLARTAQYGTALAVGGATFLGGLIGQGVFKGVRGALGDKLRVASRFMKSNPIAAGGAAVGAGVTIESLQNFSDTFSVKEPRRISDAIMLPVETIPNVQYSMKYADVDLGFTGGIIGGSSAIESSVGGRAAEGMLAGLAGLGNLAKGLPGVGGIGQTAVTATKLAAKVATNPFKEVLFEAVNYRKFTFNYTFLPKNVSEVLNVRRIIDMFKFHMHPELSESGLFYVYPSEFEMQYYFRGKENEFIHKISTCVLTDMDVTYGDQYFSSFRDGEPTEIRMGLTFQEVELLTKERIVKGY